MKITIFTDAWYPQINGVVTTLAATKAELEKRGYEVEVIHPDLFKLKVPLQPSTGIYAPLLPFGLVDDAVRGSSLIHIATEGSIGLAARYACNKYGKQFTTSFHTCYPEYVEIHTGVPTSVTWKYFRWFHSASKAVMATTPAMLDYISKGGIQNGVIWSRGVDTSVFKPAFSPPLDRIKLGAIQCIYVGRISAEKNLEAFLEIKDANIQKTLIGDGPQLEEYKAKYPDAKFLGRMTKEEIAKHLRWYDVFVFPSMTDTFGLVMIEALACGLPVAAFPNDVNEYIIENGRSGILYSDLTTAIYRANELNREDCVKRAQDFTWERATSQFLDALQSG